MAHTLGTSARAHRLIGLAAAMLLAVATGLAFARVFIGADTTLRLLGVAVAAAALAVVFERRSLLLSTVVSAAGLALAVGLVVFPGTTWYWLPTDDTLRAALDAAALVGEQARIQAAPAEPIAPLLLAAVVSLWAAIFSSHALAFRAGSPLLGLIPPVALVAFADTVLDEFVKPLYGVAFLVAALVVVFADGLARVQGWGPVWSSARRGVASFAGRRARGVAAAAVGAALLAPIFVPGFGSRALIDLGTAQTDLVAIDPFVGIQNALTKERPVEVLRVTSPRPTYLRLLSLPEYDGIRWKPDPQVGDVVPPDTPLSLPPIPDGETGSPQTVQVEVVRGFAQNWLPIPYPATTIAFPDRTVRHDAGTGSTYLDRPLEERDVYRVTTLSIQPTADDLRAVEDGSPIDGGRYIQLPEIMPFEIENLAREWTRGETSRFDKVRAIESRLRDATMFTYDETTNLRGGTSSIVDFLTTERRGFCQQFATTMAVMLRELEIDARVVIGYATSFGDRSPASPTYGVTSDRLHSWVEVWFDGWGWMPFEPTPTRANPDARYNSAPPVCTGPTCPDDQGSTGGQADDVAGPGTNQRERIEDDPRLGTRPPPLPQSPPIARQREPVVTAARILIAAAVVGASFLIVVPPVRAFRRRSRLRKVAAEPRRLILVTYEQFVERASGVGLGRDPGQTLEEYRRKVMGTGYLADGHLDRLTDLAMAAAYAAPEPADEHARQAGEAASVALREIRSGVGAGRWFAGLYRRRSP